MVTLAWFDLLEQDYEPRANMSRVTIPSHGEASFLGSIAAGFQSHESVGLIYVYGGWIRKRNLKS